MEVVCEKGDFPIAAVALEHPHIYGQCDRLIAAGADLRWVYDETPERTETFCARYPQAKVARCLDEILENPAIKLVTAAGVPSERGPLGCKVMKSGKDYFVTKAPFTDLDQLAEARNVAKKTGRKYMVYYNERLCSESATFADELIRNDAIGRVVQFMGLGPHRLSPATRPGWFFKKALYGGILNDIGSHQTEQFLHFTRAQAANILSARVENFSNPAYPELEDFGEVSLKADNNASGYFRVDWLTPGGLGTWGDGRSFILGTKGYIEMRKCLDVARDHSADHVYVVTEHSEEHHPVNGKAGCPFFGNFILDCLNRTEQAMTQEHVFKAAELCLLAQKMADTNRATLQTS